MAKTIKHKILFKKTTPAILYNLYMNADQHSVATGAPAQISDEEGSSYSVHNGYITGRNLQLIKDKLIVQSWRAQGWDAEDVDSTFIIYLQKKRTNVLVHATHVNLPDKHADSVNKGWHAHYWEPWKKYLAGEPIEKAPVM